MSKNSVPLSHLLAFSARVGTELPRHLEKINICIWSCCFFGASSFFSFLLFSSQVVDMQCEMEKRWKMFTFILDSNPKTHNLLKFGTKTVFFFVKFFFMGRISQKGFWHPPFAIVIGLITFSRGRIFFPDFCHLCLRKFREFNEDHFRQELFKVTRWNIHGLTWTNTLNL